MTGRLSVLSVSLLSICLTSHLPAQEETPPGAAPVSGASPSASPVSTTPPLSASVTPVPSPAPTQLNDVLFKNLKARATGPAVMGGRICAIHLDTVLSSVVVRYIVTRL